MASQCISEFTQSQSSIASPNSLDHGLQVYLSVNSISASKCISTLARSRPPSASPNSINHGLHVHLSSLNLGLEVHLQTSSIAAAKYIANKRRWVYGDTGVKEVE